MSADDQTPTGRAPSETSPLAGADGFDDVLVPAPVRSLTDETSVADSSDATPVVGATRVDRSAASTPERPEPQAGPLWVIRDSWVEATRHLRIVPRNPELLIFATLQPVMFVLLFVYVFGGAIEVPGFENYDQFLIPGIFAQSIVFGSAFTSLGIAEDMQKGYIDRLRSLPMSRAAVLIGRTVSDLVRNIITFFVMLAVAFLVGFRFEGTIAEAVAATLLLLGFSYALSWIQALIGLSVNSVEAANSGGFIWMFPFTFVSSAFVDPTQMPDWLQPIARNNPFTVATNAARALYNGLPAGSDATITLAWSIGITIVFAALAIRKFATSTVA